MCISIISPDSCRQEREYIYNLVFSRFLGLEYVIDFSPTDDVRIVINELEISSPDIFLSQANENWLDKKSMSFEATPVYFSTEELLDTNSIPAWFYSTDALNTGKSSIPVYEQTNNLIDIKFDLFGSIFFLISRYEEAVCTSLDEYDRFPVIESLLYQNQLYLRPLVNEYLSILSKILTIQNTNLKLKQHYFGQVISCDIDWLFFPPVKSKTDILKFIAAQAFRNKSLLNPINNTLDILKSRIFGYRYDPYNTFELLLRRAEETGSELVFYLMSGDTDSKMDGNYSLSDKRFIEVVSQLAKCDNVSFGLHGSFDSYQSGPEIRRQKRALDNFFTKHNIDCSVKHYRQHYLRWNGLTTPDAITNAGLVHDSTLSFAETSGFRSSFCHEYPLYDLIGRRTLPVFETPLIVMDGSLLQPKYLGINSNTEAQDYIWSMKNQCIKYGGKFTLLWHNSSLLSELEKELFLGATKLSP